MKYEFETFLKKKQEMEVEGLEDMRVMERMARLNPALIRCPSCGKGMQVHHWAKKDGKRVPFFKCTGCRFLG